MPNFPDWFVVIVRSFLLVLILFFITKWLGKRQISQLSFFEYITGITIGSIAAEVSSGLEDNFWHGLNSMLTWAVIPFIIGLVSLKNRKFRHFFEGEGTIFMKDGKVLEDNLKKEKITIDELLELLRKKNIFNIADVEFALLEADGDLTVLLKRDKQPLTAKDIGLKMANEKEVYTVIADGEILDEALSSCGHNRLWLRMELEKIGVTVDNVFIGQVDSFGQLTVDIYDDKLQIPMPTEKLRLLATLKKCQADFELFELETKSKEGQKMYGENAKKLARIIEKVKYLLE